MNFLKSSNDVNPVNGDYDNFFRMLKFRISQTNHNIEDAGKKVRFQEISEFNIADAEKKFCEPECKIKNNSMQRLPEFPDPHQSAVKWIALEELDSILLIPNTNQKIKNYVENKKSIDLIEDYRLDRHRLELN